MRGWVEKCCLQGGRVLVVGISNWLKNNYFLVAPPEDCRGNIVGSDGAQEKSMKQEGRRQGTTFERMT